jgi:UDP-3-O-[3-hydroxymyristoyl] glucosamine N-acyltransferase
MENFVLSHSLPLSSLDAVIAPAHRQQRISGIARFGHARAGDLCFCDREPGAEYTDVAPGSLTLCPENLAQTLTRRFTGITCIIVADPRSVFIDLGHRLLSGSAVAVSDAVSRPFGIHPSATIGVNSQIHPETRIDQAVRVGAHCTIHRGTWLKAGTTVGDHVTIGAAGMNAYRGQDNRVRKFPHFASVIVGEGAEIGSGCVLVRGILTSTRIGAGCIIGNLCNVGHGAEIGECVWISVGSLIGGHACIDDGATLGMAVAVRDNIKIGARAQVGMGSVVVKSVRPQASVFGNPAQPLRAIQAGPSR